MIEEDKLRESGMDFYTWSINNEGAFKAFLALQHALENVNTYYVKSKNQYRTFVESLINLLLTDTAARDTFLAYGGLCSLSIDVKTCKVIEVIDESKRGSGA